MRRFRISGAWALGASALLHLVFAGLAYHTSRSPRPFANGPAGAMQVETMNEKDYLSKLKARYIKETRQIVQMDERLKSESKPDEKQKVYLSKHDQVADQNMRAEHVGKFKNVDKSGAESVSAAKLFELPKDLLKAEDEKRLTESKDPQAPSGRLFTPPSRSPASLGPQGDGFSATDDYLKDVAIGAQTILNTEEYKFYSFYARVREALSAQWSYRVKQELTELYAGGAKFSDSEKITKVEVRLSRRGEIVQTRILTSSGVFELDRAASEAFRAAAPFPHPPSDMIDSLDQVSIKWDFVVYTTQSSGVRIQVQRGGM